MGLKKMHLRVRLFAYCAEAVGKREIVIKINNGMTLGDLKEHIVSLYPALKPFFQGLAFAVNGEMAEKDAALKDGDEVSLLPPVSGG